LCRYGGEEFCAILPETNRPGVARAGERLRAATERTLFEQDGVQMSLSVSIGGASWGANESTEFPDLLARADGALLEAKRAGRNQVRLAAEESTLSAS
jgi:diguanylate cyclase (GGDEF)-like protein